MYSEENGSGGDASSLIDGVGELPPTPLRYKQQKPQVKIISIITRGEIIQKVMWSLNTHSFAIPLKKLLSGSVVQSNFFVGRSHERDRVPHRSLSVWPTS